MKLRTRIVFLIAVLIFTPLCAGPILPVHIEDNHGGSFFFFADTLDAEKEYHFLLFDEHADATAIPGSDHIRKKLYEYNHFSKDEVYAPLREKGVIQCYNWIEPLMPKPFARVTWIAPFPLTKKNQTELNVFVKNQLNAYMELEERQIEDLYPLYEIKNFLSLPDSDSFTLPVAASVDLDYFAEMPLEDAEREFKNILTYLLSIKQLEALSFSISRPYLKSDKQADRLLENVLREMSLVVNTKIHFEPYLEYKDTSLKAKSYFIQRKEVPYYSINNASDGVKGILYQKNNLFHTTYNAKKLDQLLNRYLNNNFVAEIENRNLSHAKFYSDEIFLLSLKEKPTENFNWYAVVPEHKSYNILGNHGFAENDPHYVTYREIQINSLSNKTKISKSDIKLLLDSNTDTGTIRLFCKSDTGLRSNMVRITFADSKTFPGEVLGISNLPYIFGGTFLRQDKLRGPDLYYGSECSTFLIYGLRQTGLEIPYVEPLRFKSFLRQHAKVTQFNAHMAISDSALVAISQEMIDRGLILHFGQHVAAVYNDRKPVGFLDKNDLVIHHLEGFPEITALKNLKHHKQSFLVMTPETDNQ
jgi:hypothetical protein